MADRPVTLAIDLGTSGVKVLLVTPEAEPIAQSSASYPSRVPRPGWIEQDPLDWWRATVRAVTASMELARARGIDPRDVAAIGLSGHMSGLVLVNGEGEPLRPCITMSDTRATQQAARLMERMGEAIRSVTGNPVINGFMLPKLLWVLEEEPETMRRAARFLLPKDYLRFRLTACFGTEPTDAGNTLLLDPRARAWEMRLVDAASIPAHLLPELVESTQVAGRLTDDAAKELGLQGGTPVVAGGADMACSALGTGAFRRGTLAITMGTAAQVVLSVEDVSEALVGKMTFHPHAVQGRMYAMGSHFTGGLAMDWAGRLLGPPEEAAPGPGSTPAPFELLEREAARVSPGSDGLVFLPFLVGSGTPSFEARMRGTLWGLGLSHQRGHVVRAIMEGVAYNIKESVDLLRGAGLPIDSVHIGAGGLRSTLWRQILSGVLGRSLVPLHVTDASALGAAFLAGVAAGFWPDLDAAVGTGVPTVDPVEAPTGWHRRYEAAAADYQRAVQMAVQYYTHAVDA